MEEEKMTQGRALLREVALSLDIDTKAGLRGGSPES